MPDLRDRIRRDQNPMATLLDWVPGFRGYREREQRRDADRLVRQYLVGLLAECQAKVRVVTGDLARQAKLKQLTALDAVGKRLEKVTDLLRFADSGYSGWFDAVQIKEAELDRLYEYDVSLKQFISDLDAAASALAPLTEEQLPEALGKINATLDELEHMVKGREQVAADLVP